MTDDTLEKIARAPSEGLADDDLVARLHRFAYRSQKGTHNKERWKLIEQAAARIAALEAEVCRRIRTPSKGLAAKLSAIARMLRTKGTQEFTATEAEWIERAATLIAALEAEVKRLKPDARLGQALETAVCMNTHFTGDPPYVGEDGLVLAIKETHDRLIAAEAALAEALARVRTLEARERYLSAIIWHHLPQSVPCWICGYSEVGFHDPTKHPCAGLKPASEYRAAALSPDIAAALLKCAEAAEAERDRLRVALEKIASHELDDIDAIEIAREAIAAEGKP